MALLTLMLGACIPQPDATPPHPNQGARAEGSPSGELLASVPLLPASVEGHQARIDGVLAIRHGCPYLVAASGDAYLLAFLLRPVAATPNGNLAIAGRVIAAGDAIAAAGGEFTGVRSALTWERAPPAQCGDDRIWAVVALERR